MQIITQNAVCNAEPGEKRLVYARRAHGNHNALRQERQRIQAEREKKIREREDQMINDLQTRIGETLNTDMDYDIKKLKVESLTRQIKSILEKRAKREQEAAKKEMEERQAELEKERNERAEKQKAAGNPAEDPQQAVIREDIKGILRVSVSHNTLEALERTRRGMAAEAAQLTQDIDNSTGIEQYGLDITIKVKNGYSKPSDFRNTHLTKLEQGLSALTTAINAEVARMYKSNALQSERKLRILSSQVQPEPFHEMPEAELVGSLVLSKDNT